MVTFEAAEAGIRQLHARCTDAVWRKDTEAFGDCFTEDAEWRIAGAVLRGRAEIAGALGAVMGDFHRVLMTFRTPVLAVAADGTASGRVYVTEQSAFVNGQPGTSIGAYYERYVQDGDLWRFSWRLFQLLYLGPPDLTGSFYENPDYGPPPAMPPLDEPSLDHSSMGARSL